MHEGLPTATGTGRSATPRLPRHRSGRRRRQADALRPAKSPAQDRRALACSPMCLSPCAGRASMRLPWWSGRIAPTSRRGSARGAGCARFSCRPSGGARPMRCWPLARRSPQDFDDVLVVFADTPLVRPETFALLLEKHRPGAGVVALGFEPEDPTGYGRLLTGTDGQLLAIREHKDASAAERAVGLCNAGMMAFDGARALEWLERIGDDNAQKEYLSARRSRGRVRRLRLLRHRHRRRPGRGAGRQRPRATGGSGSGNPAAAAARRHARRARP